MQIDLLYFDGCPSYQLALENLKIALSIEGLNAQIRLVKVNDDIRAKALKFLGSPSFQLNGKDLWPEQRPNFNLSCRVYHTPIGLRGAPTVEMLQEKLRALKDT